MVRRFLLLIVLILAGCQAGLPPVPASPVADLAGQVQFPMRSTQATIEEVAVAATVSLINADANRTESTSLTNDLGQFRLTFPTSFRPSATASYYLEAVKGLGSNKAGNSAARVRTLARYDRGWVTITNAVVGGSIVLSTATTALCIGTSLRAGTVKAVDTTTLIGAYDPGPASFTPVTNMSGSDFTALKTLTDQILADDQDPMAGIMLTEPSQWARKNLSGLTLSQLAPSSGAIGTTVTLTGSGFDPTASNNTVRFNGIQATISGASATTLTVTVPAGATPGPVTVQVGAVAATGPTFTVTNLVYGGVVAQN